MYQPLDGGRMNGFIRTNSICPTPEETLLESVLKNDIDSIVHLIEASPSLLEHIYTPEYNKPILLIACSEETVNSSTVSTLIDLGADVKYSSDIDDEWEAIHFAASRTDSKILKVLIEKSGRINAIAKGCNALHILIRHGNTTNHQEFVECAKLLVQGGIDVNLGDNNYVSPILWAAKKGFGDIIKVILEDSSIPVDLDSHQSRKKTARDIIVSQNLYDGPLPEKIDNNNEKEESILFKYIQSSNENSFVNFKNGDIFEFVDANDTSTTLLQLCCIKGLFKAAYHLLNKGADPNSTGPKNLQKPIEIVAESGFHEIFSALIDHPKIYIPRTILVTLLKYYDNEKFPGIDHAKCYECLLDKLNKNRNLLNINEQDDSKNSSLHYAVRYADSDRVDQLLRLGASLGSKNKYGFMPIQDIEPEVLEKHLDDCVQFDIKGKKIEREDFAVTFNYKTLIPPSERTETIVNHDDPELIINQIVNQELVEETEVIYYMSRAPEFRHLLQHPVIVSFLFIKWHRIRWLFYTNLAFYFAFFLSLVFYIFASYANFSIDRAEPESGVVKFFNTILIITYFLLVFRELFQIIVAPEKYFKNFENYVELILIVITGCIIFISSPSDHLRKQLSSLSILLAAFELVLMLGQHPKLSTNVVMLKTVSFNFFKLLVWYSLLIVAFAFSFYILFSGSGDPEENKEEDLFSDIWKTFFKTIIMTTGEFDAGSINFNAYPIISKLIFSLFIFMIVIILLNLLNGLAVSDTQMIKSNAELVGHIARAEHIHYVESMLLGNILPTNFINKLNKFCCCIPVNPTRKYTMLRFLAQKACIFPHYLNYELTMYPNKGGNISIPVSRSAKSCRCCCSHLYLDKTTVRRTNSIVQEKRDKLKAEKEISDSCNIQTLLRVLEDSVKHNKLDIFMLNKKLDEILKYMAHNNKSN